MLHQLQQRLSAHVQAQRQGVDEQAQHALGGFAVLQTSREHAAEHHFVLIAGARHQHRHGHMEQRGAAHLQAPCQTAQTLCQQRWQRQLGFLDPAGLGMHFHESKGCAGGAQIRQACAEMRLGLCILPCCGRPSMRARAGDEITIGP